MIGITREHQRLIEYVTPQGVTVIRTSAGLTFTFPNGESESISWGQSDYRSLKQTRANFRRHGILWPGDPSSTAKPSTTVTKPMKATVEKVRAAVDKLTPEQLQAGVTITDVVALSGTAHYATEASLRSMFWWKQWGRLGKWFPPLQNPAEVVEEVNLPALPAAPSTAAAAPAAAPAAPARSADDLPPAAAPESWSTTLASLVVPGLTVDELVGTFAALGLNTELRIWRGND
jgi:hypothetical protein